MISRLWHGWTSFENADAYEDLLRTTMSSAISSATVANWCELVRRAYSAIHSAGVISTSRLLRHTAFWGILAPV
jgi:hypothetical protein